MSVGPESMERADKHHLSHTSTSVTRIRKCRRSSHSLAVNEPPTKAKFRIVIHRSIRSPKRIHPINSASNDTNGNLLSVR